MLIPNPNKTEFDLANALACARWAKAAYGTLAETLALQGKWGESSMIVSPDSDTEALVVHDEDVIVVAFRGTEPREMQDWITDLKFRRVENVHRGFSDAFESVAAHLLRHIQRIRTRHQRIFLTGHSLGGALAVLCAQVLDRFLSTPIVTYTFGQPRVGSSDFACEYRLGSLTHRVVNEEDIVPRLPLWLMGYRHVGNEVFLSSFGKLTFNPPLRYKLLSDVWGIIDSWSRQKLAVAADHGIHNYIQRLETLPGGAPISRSALGRERADQEIGAPGAHR